ncbi:hypothetical protein HOR65_gp03 [Staphylococcus phage St 134]|uniref:Uncharacterized protein n=1 Tax=Staphylococcus phage St 134 TaxID=1958922 RepID=A0A1S6KVC8_9CAUD|nr:hypothetical protein HOR65_gp03 [Staphylococcus phage St 134]
MMTVYHNGNFTKVFITITTYTYSNIGGEHMNYIDVELKGFTIYAKNDRHEEYDFFIPKQDYRITKREILQHIPEGHTLLDSKRTSKIITVSYYELLKIEI